MTGGFTKRTRLSGRQAAKWNRSRWALLVLAVFLFASIRLVMHLGNRLAELPELRTVELQQRDLRIAIATTGTVEPDEVVEVGSLVAGNIVGFGDAGSDSAKSVEVGTEVTKGSILVQLDRQAFRLQLQQAQAANRLAEAELVRLQTQLRHASRDLQRAETLRSTNSESQYDKVLAAFEMAESEIAIAKARSEQSVAQVKQAEINLDRTTIRSPIDGVVIDRRANLGQQVGPGSPGLFLLTNNLADMRVRASVSETDIGKIYVGQPASFSVDAYRDQVIQGQVERILMNARVDGNFVTYDVLVSIDGNSKPLLPHMTADVQLETVNRKNAWLVPSESLRWWPSEVQVGDATARIAPPEGGENLPTPGEGDTAVIWLPTREGRVRALPVRVGIDDGVHTEVIGEGLQAAMPVVVGTIRETTLARIIPSVKTLR